MRISLLLVALPLASASTLRYSGPRHVSLKSRQAGMAMNYTPISDDFFPGGKFGISNQVSVLTSFIGLGGVTADIPAMVEDLEFVFPSIKSSGWGKSIEKGFKGGIDGLIDTITAAQLAPSTPSTTSAMLTGLITSAIASGMMPTAAQLTMYYQLFESYFSDPGNLLCKFFQNPKNSFYVGYLSSYVGNPTKSMAPDACEKDTTGGTGLYVSRMIEDPSLPGHTIYAPTNKPGDNVKLPVIVWGNGGCIASGAMFQTLLTEVASHGFLVIATGTIKGGGGLTHASDLTRAIDWANSPAAKKYGNVDTSKLVAAGQSCGGLEALSASYKEPRVKFVALLNSGVVEKAKLPLLKDLTAPVAYFIGGPPDVAFPLAERDYSNLKVPALKMNINVGSLGTFYQKRGGTQGQVLVEYLNWKQKDDMKAKALFCSPFADTDFVKVGWEIVAKNGMC